LGAFHPSAFYAIKNPRQANSAALPVDVGTCARAEGSIAPPGMILSAGPEAVTIDALVIVPSVEQISKSARLTFFFGQPYGFHHLLAVPKTVTEIFLWCRQKARVTVET
jgi:hypothetical protein